MESSRRHLGITEMNVQIGRPIHSVSQVSGVSRRRSATSSQEPESGEVERLRLGLLPHILESIGCLARQRDTTPFIVFLSAWAVVLHRWSDQDEIAFVVRGSIPGDRHCEDLSDTRGVPISLRLQDDWTTEQLLEQAKLALGDAHGCPDVTFDPAVGIATATTTLELSLLASGTEEGLTGAVEYSRDLFERDAIERMSSAWQVVLTAMVKDATQRIGQLPLMSEVERKRVLVDFNTTAAPEPQHPLVHQFFEEQARRAPDATALILEQRSLTFAQLNARANQLARRLIERGIGPDQPVGLCLERGFELVIGMLAILKAGGAYLPLDPDYPRERLAYVLGSAAPRVVLTQERLRDRLAEVPGELIALDTHWPGIDTPEEESNLDPYSLGLTSRHLAYVIYTSGSTGEPKGVAAEHRGTVNRITAQQTIAPFSLQDIACQRTSIGFVDSIFEILGPLCYGRPLAIAPTAASKDVQQLTSFIEENGITRLMSVPSLARALVEATSLKAALRSLRNWTLSGEELKPDLLRKLQQVLPDCSLTNLYGSSEVADATCFVSDGMASDVVHIGRPIANMRVYVLDRYLQPVPIGVVGELYIGGAGVARGYLNRPDLTAERFIKSPFSQHGGEVLFKSGDLGWWRPDGALEYMGRNDHQVKIRGFRIELREIEAQLLHHPQVKDTVVVARETASGARDQSLVAYIVTASSLRQQLIPSLRDHLRRFLPDYMLPAAWVLLAEFPLTPSGKVDRRALPPPPKRPEELGECIAPRTGLEQRLAAVWTEVLCVDRVGAHDNFFQLGGNSLLIVQMLERLRASGLSIEAQKVFERPTLAEMAAALKDDAHERFVVPPNRISSGCGTLTPDLLPLVDLLPEHIEHIVEAIPGGASNIQDIYPLAPLQEGVLFHHVLSGSGDTDDTYVLPILLSLASRDRLDEFVQVLQIVIDRHDVLRTAVLWEQLPRPIQVVCRRATLSVEQIPAQSDHDPLEQLRERMGRQQRKLDLCRAPLIRLLVAADRHGPKWFALLETHHIICDNESVRILISEVMTCLQGRAHELPTPVPYRIHVAQALAHAGKHDAEAFFHGKLGDVDEPTAPFGLLDVQGDGTRVEVVSQALEAELARRVRVQARRSGVSAATLFHAAWALVVSRTSGRDDVVYGTVLLGRLQGNAGVQRILGMFINTLPLRLRLQDMTVTRLVEQTQQELVELLSHEQASLAVAQRCSGVAGSMPLFSALLNYRHSARNEEAQWSDAEGVRLLASQDRTHYPIVLSVDDQGEGFVLEMGADRLIGPQRMLGYMHRALQTLVEALEQAPESAAVSLSILPEPDRHQVLELLNATRAGYPGHDVPPQESASLSREYEPPEGSTEETLSQILQALLHVERIGRSENFFELGGHSLLAMQLSVRVKAAMAVDLPVSVVFEFPTLKELAAHLEEIRNARLFERLASDGASSVQELLDKVASLPDSVVQRLVHEHELGERP